MIKIFSQRIAPYSLKVKVFDQELWYGTWTETAINRINSSEIWIYYKLLTVPQIDVQLTKDSLREKTRNNE